MSPPVEDSIGYRGQRPDFNRRDRYVTVPNCRSDKIHLIEAASTLYHQADKTFFVVMCSVEIFDVKARSSDTSNKGFERYDLHVIAFGRPVAYVV